MGGGVGGEKWSEENTCPCARKSKDVLTTQSLDSP